MFKINWIAVAVVGVFLLLLAVMFAIGYRVRAQDNDFEKACAKRHGVAIEDRGGELFCFHKKMLIEIPGE
jgi:hypothetical protein